MIEDELKSIIATTARIDTHLSPETQLKDVKIDSLDMVQIIVAIEAKYEIEIDDDEAKELKTFGDLVSYVENKIKCK